MCTVGGSVVLHREKHLLPLPAPFSPMGPFPRLGSRSSNDSRRTVPSKGFVRVRMAVMERGEKGKEWSRARITCAMQKSVEKWKKATLAAASPSSSRCLIQINTRICVCMCMRTRRTGKGMIFRGCFRTNRWKKGVKGLEEMEALLLTIIISLSVVGEKGWVANSRMGARICRDRYFEFFCLGSGDCGGGQQRFFFSVLFSGRLRAARTQTRIEPP